MKIPKCFGHYARFLCEEGVGPEVCIQCEVSEHCYRATSVDALNALAADLGLLMDNLLEQGRIVDYADLGSAADDGDEFGVLPPMDR